MSINIVFSEARPDRMSVTLGVELETPKKLAVKAGSFKVLKQDYNFDEDQVWTIPSTIPDTGLFVTGYLVREKATGTPFVLVDEKELGEDELDYQFEGSAYKALYELFHVRLRKGTKSLAGLDIGVRHTQPPPEEE